MKYPAGIFRASALFLFFLFLLAGSGNSQDIPARPVPPRLVNDFSGILNPGQLSSLEEKLVLFARSSSTQIVVAIVPDLQDYEASDYASRLGEKWGVGQKDSDNGFVVLIQPKTADRNGKAFIATGYGVEEFVPDAVSKRIVESEMIPYFRENQYFEGIDKGTDVLISLTEGKYTATEYMDSTGNEGTGWVFFIMMLIFFSVLSGSRRRRYHSIGKGFPFWAALFMLGASENKHNGQYNHFHSGGLGGFGGSSGGFGGGGFGGFGGGSFGGGGAGGSW